MRGARGRRGRSCDADRGDRVAPQLPGSARARARAARPRRRSAPRRQAKRRARAAARGARPRRAVRCGAARRRGSRGARRDGCPPAPRPGLGAGGAHAGRAPRRGARRERTDQSRDRPDAVRVGQDRRYASRPHLREARPPGTAGAGAAGGSAQRERCRGPRARTRHIPDQVRRVPGQPRPRPARPRGTYVRIRPPPVTSHWTGLSAASGAEPRRACPPTPRAVRGG